MTPTTNGDSYLRLENAVPVPTAASRITGGHLKTVITHGAMMCLHGDLGLGKTFAVRLTLRDLAPDTTLAFQFPLDHPLGAIKQDLAHALHLEPGPALDRRIRQALAQRPYVLYLDEAQGLSPHALEYIRNLWQDDTLHLAVVFVGALDCRQRLRRRAALASRILIWQRYRPLHPDEVCTVMPQFHPLWRHVSPQDLLWLDDAACRGNFRDWAKLTFLLQADILNDGARLDDGFSRARARRVLEDFDPSDLHK
ncbi:AAA family ATPase, partial [Streptomyces violascens]|uniref:AAA family ATPase n=1 Tax=Streptomyces violascens TaxID=67381 RepID=UPI00369F9F01